MGSWDTLAIVVSVGITMNDADRILGPKKQVAMPPAKQSHFGRYPDVQELCDVFIEEMGWNADPYTIDRIMWGARDYKPVSYTHLTMPTILLV